MKQVPLWEVAEINPRVKKNLSPTMDCSFVPMDCIDEQYGRIIQSYTRPVSEVLKGYTPFEENDVLLAKITPCMENGKAAIAKQLVNGIGFGTTEFHVIRAKEKVLPEWIFYFIYRSDFRKQAERCMTGSAGQKRVPENFLEEAKIPLPALDEQRRIARTGPGRPPAPSAPRRPPANRHLLAVGVCGDVWGTERADNYTGSLNKNY